MGYKYSGLHNRVEHSVDASFGQLRSELTELELLRGILQILSAFGFDKAFAILSAAAQRIHGLLMARL